MTTKRIFNRAYYFALAMLLLVGLFPAWGSSEQSLENLRDAYRHLKSAQPIYKSHRIKAMWHVRKAIRLAGGSASKKVHKKTEKSEVMPVDSDSKMHMAHQCLQQSQSGLSQAAASQVDLAIKEILKGLNQS